MVDFAGGGAGDVGGGDEVGGEVVGGQGGAELVADVVEGVVGVVEDEVGGEFGAAGGVVAGGHGGVGDVVEGEQGVFDAGGFDADAADLGLAVVAAEVFEGAVGGPAGEVAGVVPAVVVVVPEAGVVVAVDGGQVAVGEGGAADVQVAAGSGWEELVVAVEDAGGDVVDRSSDGDVVDRLVRCDDRRGGVTGGFGGAVQVDDRGVRVGAPDRRRQGGAEWFARRGDHPQWCPGGDVVVGVVEHGEQRGDGDEVGDVFVGEEGGETAGIVGLVGVGDDDGDAGEQRGEQFADRVDEPRSRLHHGAIAGLVGDRPPPPRQPVAQPVERSDHPFRAARRPRGEQHPGGIVGEHPGPRAGPGDDIDDVAAVIDDDRGHRRGRIDLRPPRPRRLADHRHRHPGIGDHLHRPTDRQLDIDRHPHRTQPHHRQRRHDLRQPDTTDHPHRHPSDHTRGDQPLDHPDDNTLQRLERHHPTTTDHRHPTTTLTQPPTQQPTHRPITNPHPTPHSNNPNAAWSASSSCS